MALMKIVKVVMAAENQKEMVAMEMQMKEMCRCCR